MILRRRPAGRILSLYGAALQISTLLYIASFVAVHSLPATVSEEFSENARWKVAYYSGKDSWWVPNEICPV